MTTIAARPEAAHDGGTLPRFGMAWVTWRQHRSALAGMAVLLGGLSLLMLINGLRMRATLSSLGLNACHPVTIARCAAQLSIFDNAYSRWGHAIPGLFQAVPVLVGAFMGGPLLAREFESGTFRFAWTQGTGRVRWVVAKLVLIAAVVTAASAAFSLLFSWWYRPFFAAGGSLMTPAIFDLSGVAFAAWTLAAFALGVFAGTAIHRSVPAIAAAMAAWAGLAAATVLYLRPAYQAPIVIRQVSTIHKLPHGIVIDTSVAGPPRAWIIQSWVGSPPGTPHLAMLNAVRTGWTKYQPESRFWHFQLIEAGWLLALALLLGAATVWLVRRRAA